MPWGLNRVHSKVVCSEVQSPTVFIHPVAKSKVADLMGAYQHCEWCAHLQGTVHVNGDIFVTDLSVPEHEQATGSVAFARPFTMPKDCVGFLHSHHGMGDFHSGQDDSCVDRNYPVSITVSFDRGKGHGLVWNATSFIKTPCGKRTEVKPRVQFVAPLLLYDKEQFLEDAKRNIDKGRVSKPLPLLAELNGNSRTVIPGGVPIPGMEGRKEQSTEHLE